MAAAGSQFEMAARAADGAAARCGSAVALRTMEALSTSRARRIATASGLAATDAADAVSRAAYAAFAAGRLRDGKPWGPADIMAVVTDAADNLLIEFANDVVDILVEMKTPGSTMLRALESK